MKKLIVTTCAALSLVAISSPAAAQGYGRGHGYGSSYGYGGASQRLQNRIERGIQRGTIDRREARYLHQKLQQLIWQERRLERSGYDRGGVRMLQVRVAGLERAIRKYESDGGYARRGYGRDRDYYDYD